MAEQDPVLTAAQYLHTRQLVRFYNDEAVPAALKTRVAAPILFHARWILEDLSKQARSPRPETYTATAGEWHFPQGWLTQQGITVAVQEFHAFSRPLLPTWLPTMIYAGNIPRNSRYPQVIQDLVIKDSLAGHAHLVNITPIDGPGTEHKKIVMKVLDLALRLLTTDHSMNALQSILRRLITDWDHFGMPHAFPVGMDHTDADTRRELINFFCNRLRGSHPEVLIESNEELEGCDAETRRRMLLAVGQTGLGFNPSQSCRIFVNRLVSRASDQKN